MPDTSGSTRKCQLGGITFRVAADANLSQIFTKFENDMIATSGDGMRKMTKRIQTLESLDLITNALERDQLKVISEAIANTTISVTNAAGDVADATGCIEIEKYESEENKTTVKFCPVADWVVSIAP
jgi:ribosomal protein S7